MKRVSLFQQGYYSLEWIKDFYDQTGIWWGPNVDQDYYQERVRTLERLCGPGSKKVLDLGAGPGGTAATMADAGHAVVAVELSPGRIQFARQLAKLPHKGSLRVIEGDFYTVKLEERFDVVCCWEVFGLGSDADQRQLLRRIASDWLAPGGMALLDVYSPVRPARAAGKEEILPPLPCVPGSVEMINRCHFDPLHSRWIDEWQPVASPEQALAQTVRCYSPADFLLLLEGTGLSLRWIDVNGTELDFASSEIITSGPLMEEYYYRALLSADDKN